MRFVSLLKYIVIFAFFVACFLVYTLPASFVWQFAQPHVQKNLLHLNIKVNDVAGTVWHGQALVQAPHNAGVLEWQFDFSSVLAGQVGAKISLNADPGTLDEQFLSIEHAQISLKRLNAYLIRQKITLDGDFQVKNVRLVRRERRIADSIGSLSWTGGTISYPAGKDIHTRELPPFKGDIHWQDQAALLGLRDDKAGFDVVTVVLDQKGWLRLNATKRLLDLADEPWPRSAKEEQSVFSLRQQVFRE
jgi:hypothetical protein